MISVQVVLCAICSHRVDSFGSKDEMKQELANDGWGCTDEVGWVCRNCLRMSVPLRKLVPESVLIVKNQAISE